MKLRNFGSSVDVSLVTAREALIERLAAELETYCVLVDDGFLAFGDYVEQQRRVLSANPEVASEVMHRLSRPEPARDMEAEYREAVGRC